MEVFKVALGTDDFVRMKMILTRNLGHDADTDNNFKCRWSQLMEAFDDALRVDTGVKCLAAFYQDTEDVVGGQVVDVAFHLINNKVNKYFGTKDEEYTNQAGTICTTRDLKNSF